jgi:Roadblock/LC7 domain
MEDDEAPDVCLRRMMQQPGVQSYVIFNSSGIPIKFHGMEQNKALQYSALLSDLNIRAGNFLNADAKDQSDPNDDVVTLRLRTKQGELIIAPDGDFIMAVMYGNKIASDSTIPDTKADEKNAA